MEAIMSAIALPLGILLEGCQNIFGNYGISIVVFTLLTKVILFPVSMWVHKNSLQMVAIMPEINRLKVSHYGDNEFIAEETQTIYKKNHYHPFGNSLPLLVQIVLLMGVIEVVNQQLGSSGSILATTPFEAGGMTLLMPVLAGLAAFILSIAMVKLNPLQEEQSFWQQLSTSAVSVGISLFLGAFVTLGVCIYWIAGNLSSILQQMLLNAIIKPSKYIDYPALRESQKQLQSIENLGQKVSPEDKKREKADYKRFFNVANKHLVFYSEGSGFYKYFKDLIEYITKKSNVIIHYVTRDPKDQIFEIAKTNTQIRPYYIGDKKFITLMMKLDCDIMVMSTPDLENYHIKRSYVRKDIEYIYIDHGVGSPNLQFRTHALDHFDTIFCTSPYVKQDLLALEEHYQTKEKNLLECGYSLMDQMLWDYEKKEHQKNNKTTILIAPSWQKDNIMDLCLDEMLVALLGRGYRIVVRPHPQYVRLYPAKMETLIQKYKDYSTNELEIQRDFSDSSIVLQADVMITDWSNIGYEFSFTTLKPSLYINTPMKIMNPEWKKIEVTPMDILLRDQIGKSFEVSELSKIPEMIDHMIASQNQYAEKIKNVREETIFNFGTGNCAEQEGNYILKALVAQKQKG